MRADSALGQKPSRLGGSQFREMQTAGANAPAAPLRQLGTIRPQPHSTRSEQAVAPRTAPARSAVVAPDGCCLDIPPAPSRSAGDPEPRPALARRRAGSRRHEEGTPPPPKARLLRTGPASALRQGA